MSEQRKASEILLDLESKLDKLISLTESQGLSNRILSNKLNEVMTALSKQASSPGKITVEAVNATVPTTPLKSFQPIDPERQISIFAETKLPETDSPKGFRRTSRPETFSEANASPAIPPQPQQVPKFPVQMVKGGPPPGREVTPEAIVSLPKPVVPPQAPTNKPVKAPLAQNAVPVHQRVVDKNGKSIFLADVEVVDAASGQPVHKTRTNGTGKWMASLGVGAYRVAIRKREGLNKDKAALEAIQDIQVDGEKSPLELQTLIIY